MKRRRKAERRPPRPSGFPCPLCDATGTRVLRTATIDGKLQRRRRRCPNGHEFDTDETVRAEGERISAPDPAFVRQVADSVVEALKSDPLYHLHRGTMNRDGGPNV